MKQYVTLYCTSCESNWQEPTDTSKQPIRTCYLGHVTGYHPIRDQYFLIRSVPANRDPTSLPGTNTSKQPIRNLYLGRLTGCQPIRHQHFGRLLSSPLPLIRPGLMLCILCMGIGER
eukprot:sb/3476570/